MDDVKDPVILIIGAGVPGQIGYALVPMIARGVMLGTDQPVILHMLDIPPAAEALNRMKMELVDATFPLLKGVVATTDAVEACTGVNVAVMVGGFPWKEGMERKDVMTKNVSIYKSQASALEKHAAPNCKVLFVANPANTNASVVEKFAPYIPQKNITQYPDVNHATVKTPAGDGGGFRGCPGYSPEHSWQKITVLNGEIIATVQQRDTAIIASSASDHIRDSGPWNLKGYTNFSLFSEIEKEEKFIQDRKELLTRFWKKLPLDTPLKEAELRLNALREEGKFRVIEMALKYRGNGSEGNSA